MRTVLAEDLLATHDAGTVDQPVEATECLDRRLHRRFCRRFVADVGDNALRAQALGLGRDGFGIHVHQHYLGTGCHEHFSGGRTEAGGTAGDEKNLVFDLHH
ncbi:hypothetical protein D9M73_169460 [compost metagenome]